METLKKTETIKEWASQGIGESYGGDTPIFETRELKVLVGRLKGKNGLNNVTGWSGSGKTTIFKELRNLPGTFAVEWRTKQSLFDRLTDAPKGAGVEAEETTRQEDAEELVTAIESAVAEFGKETVNRFLAKKYDMVPVENPYIPTRMVGGIADPLKFKPVETVTRIAQRIAKGKENGGTQ